MSYNTALPFFSKKDIEEIISQLEVILNGNGLLTKGPKVKEFEKLFAKYIGSNFGVAVNSGTSALELALKSICINDGDEVIVPTQTFVSTASSVINNGGIPIFCEINQNHLIDFDDLKAKITDNTKAVIIVHFAGLIHPDIWQIKTYLKERNIYLIEDAAHAHGAQIDNVFAGNIGDFGCFSFYSTKIMTTGGEGGFITTNNEKLFDLCSSLGAIGIDKKSKNEIYINSGSNNRLTEFQAIMGISQLNKLEFFVKHRNEIAGIYKYRLSRLVEEGKIKFQEYPKNIRHPFWMFMVLIDNKDHNRIDIKNTLMKDNININWPYQPLLHQQPVFSHLNQINLKKSEEYARNHLCLPIHLGISTEDAEYISTKFTKCLDF